MQRDNSGSILVLLPMVLQGFLDRYQFIWGGTVIPWGSKGTESCLVPSGDASDFWRRVFDYALIYFPEQGFENCPAPLPGQLLFSNKEGAVLLSRLQDSYNIAMLFEKEERRALRRCG